jgi:lipopolysaccharide/colanic/teichoic acid biosynthesis glycosyltransferase/glycosyltransferase involved in cell wall biosynthesis
MAEGKILVVDDDHQFLKLVTTIFIKNGFQVETAEDGFTGIAKVAETNPDLILLDVMMPGMNGWDAYASMKESGTPIIFLTAKTDNDSVAHGLGLGAEDYMLKPIAPKAMIDRVRHTLTQLEQAQTNEQAQVQIPALPRFATRLPLFSPGIYAVAKRLLDIVAGIVGSVITILISIPLAIWITRDSPGPIFFQQVRVGKNGAPVPVLKFRTMQQGTPSYGQNGRFSMENYITRAGKFLRRTSLDEFPQFFSVLKGDMSLVGPRPELPNVTARYTPDQKRRRLSVRPGVTGWWQINGKKQPMAAYVQLDLDYVAHRSFRFDLYITFMTVWQIISPLIHNPRATIKARAGTARWTARTIVASIPILSRAGVIVQRQLLRIKRSRELQESAIAHLAGTTQPHRNRPYRAAPATAKTRIGMVVHNYYLRDARVRRYAEALASEDYEVHVYCLKDKNEAAQDEQYNGVNIHRMSLTRKRGHLVKYLIEYGWSFILFFLRITLDHLKSPFSVFHVHNMPDFLVFVALVPRLTGAFVILDLHDPMPELYLSKAKKQKPDLVYKVLCVAERISTRFANVVITATEMFKETFVARGVPAEKILVIVNAADPKIFDPALRKRMSNGNGNHHTPNNGHNGHNGHEKESFRLLYIGTVAERYGLDVVVRGLSLLKDEIPNVHLDILCKIYGEGTGLDELMELVGELGLDRYVTVHEPVPLEQVPMHMLKADAAVYTPRTDPHMDTALSLKIPEFTAMGVPIIATRLSVLEHYFGSAGILFFPEGDVEAFAAQVARLYHGEINVSELVGNAARFLVDYSWECEKQRYMKTITGVVNRAHVLVPEI